MNAIVLNNRIEFGLTDEENQAVQGALKTLNDVLLPKLIDLGVDGRKGLARMGAKTVDFVAKALSYARSDPQFKPPFLDVDEFARDLAAVGTLRQLAQPLRKLADMTDDSLILSGSEAYCAALAYYQGAKTGARLSQPGAATIATDLAARFPGRPTRVAKAAAGALAETTSPGTPA